MILNKAILDEEKGRLFLAVRGQMTHVAGGRPPVLVSTIGDENELARAVTDEHVGPPMKVEYKNIRLKNW